MSFRDGLVVGHERSLYRIQWGDHQLKATLRGKIQFASQDAVQLPVIGDVVHGQLVGDQAVIAEVAPRRSLLARQGVGGAGVQPLAANVDYALIASSLNQDLNLNRLERYLTLSYDAGVQPVIVLTKRDLNPDWPAIRAECERRAPGVEVVTTSARDDYSALQDFVSDGRVSVLLGSSGVGKSTLVNRLLGREVLDTGGIRLDDDKGRHTTTSRSMWRAPTGGWIIDTPGMRELHLRAVEEGLSLTFADVEELFGHCRFRDCAHSQEPNCAVKQALADGTLAWERWENYGKLEREIAFRANRWRGRRL